MREIVLREFKIRDSRVAYQLDWVIGHLLWEDDERDLWEIVAVLPRRMLNVRTIRQC